MLEHADQKVIQDGKSGGREWSKDKESVEREGNREKNSRTTEKGQNERLSE